MNGQPLTTSLTISAAVAGSSLRVTAMPASRYDRSLTSTLNAELVFARLKGMPLSVRTRAPLAGDEVVAARLALARDAVRLRAIGGVACQPLTRAGSDFDRLDRPWIVGADRDGRHRDHRIRGQLRMRGLAAGCGSQPLASNSM